MAKMTEKQQLREKLTRLIESDEAFVATVSGEWGSGKTYFVKELINSEEIKRKAIYISLFDIGSIEDIKDEIIVQMSKLGKYKTMLKKNIPEFSLSVGAGVNAGVNVNIGKLLSFIKIKDFSDLVICFDDFERIKKEGDFPRQLLGLISNLKEQFNTKVIMIMNENELKEIESTYKEYKEKVVDFGFMFLPKPEDSLEIACIGLHETPKRVLEDYCKEKNISNIRIIKQIKRILDDDEFKFIYNSDYHETVVDSELRSLIKKAYVYYRFDLRDFKALFKYFIDRYEADKDFKKNDEYEKTINYIYSFRVFSEENDFFIDYFEDFSFDKQKYMKFLRWESNNTELRDRLNNLRGRINGLFDNLIFDYKNTPDFEEFEAVLSEKEIIQSINADNFIWCISELKKIYVNHEKEIDALSRNAWQSYIEFLKNNENEERLTFRGNSIVELMLQQHPELKGLTNDLETPCNLEEDKETFGRIIGKLLIVNERRQSDAHYINSISKSFLKECLFDRQLAAKICKLSHKKYFPEFNNSLKECLVEIEKENINTPGIEERIRIYKSWAGLNDE